MTTQTELTSRPKGKTEPTIECRELCALDLVFAVFFYSWHLVNPVDRTLCHRIVRDLYADYGTTLSSLRITPRASAILDQDVDSAIDKLLSLMYIEPTENHAYRITESGLWQYDSSVASKLIANSALLTVFTRLNTTLRSVDFARFRFLCCTSDSQDKLREESRELG